MRRALAAVSAVVALAAPAAAYAGFSPNDPLAPRQWYIGKDRVFDSFDSFSVLPQLLTVRVAVLNDTLEHAFRTWHARFRPLEGPAASRAA